MSPLEEGKLSDLRQSDSYASYMKSLGWQIDKIGETVTFSKKLPVLGTIIKITRPNLPLPMEEIGRLAKERQAFLVKIEPNLLVEGFKPTLMAGFVKDASPILPTKTIWIDLSTTSDQLWANLDKDTRNLVRRAEKEGVAVLESKDLTNFYQLWAGNAKKKGFFVPFEKEMNLLWRAFHDKRLLVAKFRGEIVAAAMLFGYQGTLYYSFAGSSESGKKVHAPYLLLWEIISRGKKWNYRKLDLEGIVDPKVGRTKNWAGFTHFKRGFGGREIEYAGSFSKYYSLWGKILGRFI